MLQLVREIQTRFLWPFVFKRKGVEAASGALRAFRFEGMETWRCAPPPRHYQDEYLDHATEFLFGGAGQSCEYLVFDAGLCERWLADCELDMGHDAWRLLRSVPGPGVELFLSPHGIGVLSVTLAPSTESLTADTALDFNYRLSQHRRRSTGVLRKRHPVFDPDVLARIPPAQRDRLNHPPPKDAPIEEQLGVRGGVYELGHLVELMLGPLRDLGYRAVQREFCVYTIARLGKSPEPPDLSELRSSPDVGRFLSALCQVEESGHAGSSPGEITADHALLNSLHRSAVCPLGAAHVVADQGGVPYDDQRLVTVRDKYFPAYLFALLQRVTLNADFRRAGRISKLPEPKALSALRSLRRHLMDFSIRGNAVEVSNRNAVQRFYELARTGLRIEPTWNEVRRTIQDIDADNAAREQARMAGQQTLIAKEAEKHLDAIRHVQQLLHVLEYVLVPVYLAHFADMLEIGEAKGGVNGHNVLMFSAAGAGVLLVMGLDMLFRSLRRSHQSTK